MTFDVNPSFPGGIQSNAIRVPSGSIFPYLRSTVTRTGVLNQEQGRHA
jgi:hypothetical protein